MQVRWSPEAEKDVFRIRSYIAEFNPWAASRVAVQLLATADSLEHLPRRGRPGRLPGKWELVPVQPFVIVCRVGPPSKSSASGTAPSAIGGRGPGR